MATALFPSCSIKLLRRLARSESRSRCQDAGGAPATFHVCESAAARLPASRHTETISRFIEPSQESLHYKRLQWLDMEHYTWDEMEKEVLSPTIARKII